MTYIILLDNRELLEKVEGSMFDSLEDFLKYLSENDMTKEQEETLGYYSLDEFCQLVNDQVIDKDLSGTFITHININTI